MAGERGGFDSPDNIPGENKELTSVLLPENSVSPDAPADPNEAAEQQAVKAKTAREKLSDIWRQAGEDATRLHDEQFDPNAAYEGTPGGDENTIKPERVPDALEMNSIHAKVEQRENEHFGITPPDREWPLDGIRKKIEDAPDTYRQYRADKKAAKEAKKREFEERMTRIREEGERLDERLAAQQDESHERRRVPDLNTPEVAAFKQWLSGTDGSPFEGRWTAEKNLKLLRDLAAEGSISSRPQEIISDTSQLHRREKQNVFSKAWEAFLSEGIKTGGSYAAIEAYKIKDHDDAAFIMVWEETKDGTTPIGWSVAKVKGGKAFAEKDGEVTASDKLKKLIEESKFESAVNKQWISSTPPASGEVYKDIQTPHDTPRSVAGRNTAARNGIFKDIDHGHHQPAAGAGETFAMPAAPRPAPAAEQEPPTMLGNPVSLGERVAPGEYRQPSDAQPPQAEDVIDAEIIEDDQPTTTTDSFEVPSTEVPTEATPNVDEKSRIEPPEASPENSDKRAKKAKLKQQSKAGEGPQVPESVVSTPESVATPEPAPAPQPAPTEATSSKEYSVSHEGDGLSAFSEQVHRIQESDETFGVPDSRQLNQFQVQRLAERAATLEELQTLRGEIDQREKQASKDDRLFEKRTYGQDNEREVQVARTPEAREIEFILYKRRQQLVDEARGHGLGGVKAPTRQDKIRAPDKDAEIENIAWVRKQENLQHKVKGSQDNSPETLESRDEDVRNSVERVRDNTRKAHVKQIVDTIEKFKNGTLEGDKPDKLLRETLADAVGSGLLKKEPKKPFEVVSTGSELSEEVMAALSGIETKAKKAAAEIEPPQEQGEPEPDIQEINKKLDELKAAARETSPEVPVEGAKVEPDIHEINRKLDELKDKAAQESATDELMAEVGRLAGSDPSRVNWDDRWNDIYDRTIESELAVPDADSVSGLGVIAGSAESEEIVNKIGDVYEDILKAGDLLEQIRQVNLAQEDETSKAEQLRSLYEQAAEEGFVKLDPKSQPYGVSLPDQPTAAAWTFMSGLEKAHNPESEDGAADEGAELSLDERIGQALNDGAGQSDRNDRRRRGRGRR